MRNIEKAGRMVAGLVIMVLGTIMVAAMVDMGRYARWEEAGLHDIASWAFSLCFALGIAAGGALMILNPPIRGTRIW